MSIDIFLVIWVTSGLKWRYRRTSMDAVHLQAMMVPLSLSKPRILFLCVGCCSCVMIATLRLQFLLSQTFRDDPQLLLRLHNSTLAHQKQHLVQGNVARTIAQAPPNLRNSNAMLDQQEVRVPDTVALVVDAKDNGIRNSRQHFPSYFTDTVPFETLLRRDNLISVFTGCSIASWTYSGVPFPKHKVRFYDDCKSYTQEFNLTTTSRDVTSETAVDLLKPGDTLYVEFMKMSHFVQYTLPNISVDVVLISGQNHLVPQKPKPLDYVWTRDDFDAIVNHPHITHWFLMNMDVYAQDPDHAKLHPFPYGLGSMGKHTPDTAEVGMNPMQAFREELSVEGVEKNNSIFVGYFSMRTNKAKRKLVPQGNKLHPTIHFRQMHSSNYVVSPDGDRPDCYRHYESIGLNAMPITQMHPKYYRHLAGNVIFNNTNWNLTELQHVLPKNPKVNRRLVFEEYWMEYVERIVGHPLTWWDSKRLVRCSLSDVIETVKSE